MGILCEQNIKPQTIVEMKMNPWPIDHISFKRRRRRRRYHRDQNRNGVEEEGRGGKKHIKAQKCFRKIESSNIKFCWSYENLSNWLNLKKKKMKEHFYKMVLHKPYTVT